MNFWKISLQSLLLLLVLAQSHPLLRAQEPGGRIRGMVTLAGEGTPLHDVPVRIIETGLATLTEEGGSYVFPDLQPGTYTVLARMDGFRDIVVTVTVSEGVTATVDMELRLLGPREEITVTATGREEVAFQSFQTVTTLDSVQLAENAHVSLGEVLENQSGVARRSFGPGSSRPVIRGFDGDRVLILQDGAQTGSLSSQSGDHGEPINALSLEKLEVVKGPATLLYGSNALGGVVNALTGHDHPHPGFRGTLAGVLGSANGHGGGHAGFEYGHENWLLWGGGGGQRTGDYETPLGVVANSKTRVSNASTGVGWYGDDGFLRVGYGYDDGRYGVPFAAEFEGSDPGGNEPGGAESIDLKFRRHNLPVQFGFQNWTGILRDLQVRLNYSAWHQEELEGENIQTIFDNRQFTYRSVFSQRTGRVLSGTIGFEGGFRDYESVGAEALAPPVTRNHFALFALEELDYQRVRLQFGARMESTGYDPEGLFSRRFTGLSGAAGVHLPLWEGGAMVLNYTHSFRAPALEELYNNGPHIGNLTFERGDSLLGPERANGIEVSLRHSSSRVRFQGNFYYYRIHDFVFLAPTGEVEDGLNVAEYSQEMSRFTGGELQLDLGLHPSLWLHAGFDTVDAGLTGSGSPLPRIPPVRGRVGLEWQVRSFRFKPELHLVRNQDQIFVSETPTAGYALLHFNASYTLARQHLVHIFSVNAFNLGDRLYRNHLSFIKELAPEIGRGVRVTYLLRLF